VPGVAEGPLGLVADVVPAAATTSGSTSWRNVSTGSKGATGSRRSDLAHRRAASGWPVASHHCPGDSTRAGTMEATSTISPTGTWVATNGAVKAAID
jgi:hypothetical protein